MPGKDPAALFYIDHWLVVTREMRADCRGWYLNLVLHQFKSGDLPSDLEELANLAGVRISEYQVFQQVFQQVLKQRFQLLGNGRIQDIEAAEIVRAREGFKEKRAAAGRLSAFTKLIRKELCTDENVISFIKQNVKDEQIVTMDQQVLKHVFKQLFQLYINKNKDRNRDKEKGGMGEEDEGPDGWNAFPGEKQLSIDIPEIKLSCAQELMFHNGHDPTVQQMRSLWKNFKIQNFTGRKFYEDPDQVYSHFINWSKTQKVNGKSYKSNSSNGKSAGATQLVQSLGADLATGGASDPSG